MVNEIGIKKKMFQVVECKIFGYKRIVNVSL